MVSTKKLMLRIPGRALKTAPPAALRVHSRSLFFFHISLRLVCLEHWPKRAFLFGGGEPVNLNKQEGEWSGLGCPSTERVIRRTALNQVVGWSWFGFPVG